MTQDVINFLIQNEIAIYAGLGVCAFWFINRLFKAIAEWRESAFGWEREIAKRKFISHLLPLILIFLSAFSVFFLVTYAGSMLLNTASLATPTMDVLATATATLPPTQDAAQVLLTVEVTQTPAADGCVPGQLEWIDPQAGNELRGVVTLIATVNIPNFGFYKYEYTEPGNSIWKTIAGGNQPKENEEIGLWNTTQLIPGDYLLRLVVLDNQNIEYPACIVPIRVFMESEDAAN